MLYRLKLSISGQFFLVAAAAIFVLISAFWDVSSPALRLDAAHLLLALPWAAALFAVNTAGIWLLLRRNNESRGQLASLLAAGSRINRFVLAGGAAAAGCGEEVLLRGLLFNALSIVSLWSAWAANTAAVFLGYFTGRRSAGFAAVKTVEGSLLALCFQLSHSLFTAACAHAAAYLAFGILLRTDRAQNLLRRGQHPL